LGGSFRAMGLSSLCRSTFLLMFLSMNCACSCCLGAFCCLLLLLYLPQTFLFMGFFLYSRSVSSVCLSSYTVLSLSTYILTPLLWVLPVGTGLCLFCFTICKFSFSTSRSGLCFLLPAYTARPLHVRLLGPAAGCLPAACDFISSVPLQEYCYLEQILDWSGYLLLPGVRPACLFCHALCSHSLLLSHTLPVQALSTCWASAALPAPYLPSNSFSSTSPLQEFWELQESSSFSSASCLHAPIPALCFLRFLPASACLSEHLSAFFPFIHVESPYFPWSACYSCMRAAAKGGRRRGQTTPATLCLLVLWMGLLYRRDKHISAALLLASAICASAKHNISQHHI